MKKILFILFCILIVNIFAEDKELSTIYLQQGIQKYISGDLDGAIESIEESIKFYPNNKKAKNAIVNIYVFKGKKLFEEKQYKSAKDVFTKLLKIDSSNVDAKAYLLKIKNLKKKGEFIIDKQIKKKKTLEEKLTKESEKKGVDVNNDKLQIEKQQGQQMTGTGYQKIVIETKNLGSSDSKRMGQFLNLLKEMRGSESSNVLKLDELRAKREKEIKDREKERLQTQKNQQIKNIIFLSIIFVLIVGGVIFFIWIIVKIYRKRIKQFEEDRNFYMQREAMMIKKEAEILQIAGGASSGQQAPGKPLMIGENSTEVQPKNVIVIPNAKILKMQSHYTLKEINQDLTSQVVRIRIDALVAAYYHDSDRLFGIAENIIMNENDNINLISGLLWSLMAIEDHNGVDIIFRNKQSINLEKPQIRRSLIRTLSFYRDNPQIMEDNSEKLKNINNLLDELKGNFNEEIPEV